jgi:FAD binding domain
MRLGNKNANNRKLFCINGDNFPSFGTSKLLSGPICRSLVQGGGSMGYDTDVFIVGGGPAGLAAGIALRARGFRVIVADGVAPPITKACGEGLLPDGLAALRELGVELQESDGFPLRVRPRGVSNRAGSRGTPRNPASKNVGASPGLRCYLHVEYAHYWTAPRRCRRRRD